MKFSDPDISAFFETTDPEEGATLALISMEQHGYRLNMLLTRDSIESLRDELDRIADAMPLVERKYRFVMRVFDREYTSASFSSSSSPQEVVKNEGLTHETTRLEVYKHSPDGNSAEWVLA